MNTDKAEGGGVRCFQLRCWRFSEIRCFTPSRKAASHGRIAVTYYDTRNDAAGNNSLLTNYWQVESSDRGDTWTETGLAGPFDLATGPVPGGGSYFPGDYEGLAASTDFLGVLCRHGAGQHTANLQPLQHRHASAFYARTLAGSDSVKTDGRCPPTGDKIAGVAEGLKTNI